MTGRYDGELWVNVADKCGESDEGVQIDRKALSTGGVLYLSWRINTMFSIRLRDMRRYSKLSQSYIH